GYNGSNIDHLAWSEVAPASILEAELALLNKVVITSKNPGYTGTGYVDYINSSGDYVEWTLNKPNAGSASLKFRYANGSSTNRPLKLEINGQVVASSLAFLPTGSWSTWSNTGITVNLLSGTNKIRITAIGYNGANIDHLAWSEIASAAQNISSQAQSVLATGLKVSVLPNPVVGIAKLVLSTSTDGPVEIMLVDMVGKVHKRLSYKNIGTNHFNLPVNDLPSGLYIVFIKQGMNNAFTRFVIAR
nr:carbohydrate-binding protein [Chitinophagaceae bacterium]